MLRIVTLGKKNRQYLKINPETNPPVFIVNVVSKYFRRIRGSLFDVATLPTYCNID